MKESVCNLWDRRAHVSAVCVTTNGDVNFRGEAVMGRGVAQQAKRLFPRAPKILGRSIAEHGNHVAMIVDEPTLTLVSFPVKHHWHEPADLELIRRSAEELVALADAEAFTTVLLPRPGCGNGQRTWAEVKSVIAPVLDDRFEIVCTQADWERER